MAKTATASFNVTGWDETVYRESTDGPRLSRATVAKTFQGDLVGESTAELLMCRADPDNAEAGAGYVANELIAGRLHDREGTFVVQHGGLMVGADTRKTFGHIVPGTGTGALAGVSGSVVIAVDGEGRHTLSLTYDINPS